MTYHAPTAAGAALLALLCFEGFMVALWRGSRRAVRSRTRPFAEGEVRAEKRRAIRLLCLAVLGLAARPVVLAHPPRRVAVLGLVRTFTRQACDEWGWTVACILPVTAAIGALIR